MSDNEVVAEQQVPIELIDLPTNPIRAVDGAVINDLRESIKIYGILQPLLLRPKSDGRFEVVFGSNRIIAAKGAGLKTVPAKIRNLSDRDCLLLALTENIQRSNMDPVREGEILFDLTYKGGRSVIKTIAIQIGKSSSYVEGRILLFTNLHADLRAEVGKTLSLTNALRIARLEKATQLKVYNAIQRIAAIHDPTKDPYGGGYVLAGASIYCTCPVCGTKHLKGVVEKRGKEQ
jgi:ParB family chromosome partitioning protein